MEIHIQAIEKVDLPNYIETIWSGNDSHEREAPLLAKYRVDLTTPRGKVALFYELRDQPNGVPLIDEYYEDQVYEALMAIVEPLDNAKARNVAQAQLNDQIVRAVFDVFNSSVPTFPIRLILSK